MKIRTPLPVQSIAHINTGEEDFEEGENDEDRIAADKAKQVV